MSGELCGYLLNHLGEIVPRAYTLIGVVVDAGLGVDNWLLAVNNFVVELWLHLSIIQARLILHSVCTNLGFWLLAQGS